MKNFTKQNFKTNPLWIRLLIMTFMLLAGSGSAWAYNQSAVDLYFDNSEAKWSNCYVYIGHVSYTSCYNMTRVSGTQYLWKLASSFNNGSSWNNATGWVVCSEKWWASANESIDKYTWHGDKNVTQKKTSAWSASYIYKTNGTASTTSDSHTITAYKTTTVSNKNYTVTINSATGGTLTVKDYDNNAVSSGASKIYLTVLKFSATPVSGYELQEIQIYDGSTTTTISASTTYTLKSNVTITPVWKKICTTVETPNVTPSTSSVCPGSTVTLTLNNRQDGVTYEVDGATAFSGSTNTYTSAALNADKRFTIVASHEDACDNDIESTVDVTIKSAPTKPVVTLSPADGNIISGNSATLSVTPQTDVTFTLYKDGVSTGNTGNSFEITESGAYYVIGTDECGQDSPESDSKTITVCTPNATLLSATYNETTDKIDLSGNLTEACGKNIYYGFLWKEKGNEWDTNNAISGTGGNNNSTSTNNKEFSQSWDGAASGTTYVFTAYALNASTNPYTWYYDETGIEVSKCITVATPNVTAEPICAGSEATLTLNYKQNGVTYELDNTKIIFTSGNTHTVKPEKTTTYTITATSTISCVANQTATTTVQVEVKDLPEPPAISSETTVCPNTIFELPSIGDGKWYAQAEGGAAYGSNTITNGVAATTYYYAEAVKNGCASATRTKYTVNVYEAPVTPVVSFDPTIVGQNKNSVLTISNETYTPGTATYELYKGNNKVKDITAQNTNVSESEATTHTYTVKATSKACASLTSTSDPVTLTVQESGAQIAPLGDLKIDTQDPVDFVAMYVKKDGIVDVDGATKVTAYTWEYSNDDGNSWTECASTATIGVTNGSDKCNNFRPSAVGKYRCKITYDKGEQTSNVLTVTGDGSTAKTFKGVTMNIPVISVNTGSGKFPTCDGLSGTASKNADVMKEKISVDVKIFNADGTVYYDRKARMNYRGSSSLNFVKKSYAFCTGKEKTKNDKGAVDTGKENLFGLSNGAKDKDWVLYAAAADPSIMRNRLMFDTFRDMTGGWSVNSMYVELVINGEYKGVYVLMDKITANEKRVNVSWKLDKQGNTTQEGFIVKFDKTDIVDRYENTSGDQKTFKSTYSGHDGFGTYDTNIDQRFEVEYPEKEDIEEEDLEKGQQAGDWSVVFNAIKDKFNKFEKELKDGNFSEVQKIIDYQSWADWFIITEFGKNIDGYRASNLFVYDGSKPNAKIEARPLWDQELSFNNTCPNYYESYGAGSTTGFIVENSEGFNNDASTPFWFTGKYKGGRGTYNGSDQTFKGLLDDPCFVAVVKSRWETHKANALSKATLEAKLTAYTDEMGAAKDREATFWSTRSRQTCQCSYGGTTGYNNIDFATSKGTISSWIENRPAGLNTAINGLTGLDLTISFTMTPADGVTTPWEAVMVQVNNPSGYDYDLKYTNDLDKVEGVIIQESNDKYTYRIPRPWESGDGTREAIEYGIEATLNVAEEGNQCGSEIGEELTKATATITLKDEENDGCSITE